MESIDKLLSKLDEKKMEEISNLIDLTPTLNNLLRKIDELETSGSLDTLINSTYVIRTLRDMLNDDAVENLGVILSSLLTIGKEISKEDVFNNVKEIIDNSSAIAELSKKLKSMEQDGSLDALINVSYSIKSMKDMLNDEAIESIGGTLSDSLELMKELNKNFSHVKQLIDKSPVLSEVLTRLDTMKNDGTLDTLVNSAYAVKTFKDMLTDDAIQNIGNYISNLLEIMKELDYNTLQSIKSTMKKLGTINDVLDKVEELNNTGALDAAMNLAYAAKTMRDMLNDDALTHISAYVSQFLEAYPKAMKFLDVALSDVPNRIVRAVTSEEVKKGIESPPQVSLGNLIKLMSDPTIQRGLGVLFVLVRAIGNEFK
jgi:uncharacterized protein YjgD (DUF1641 family)